MEKVKTNKELIQKEIIDSKENLQPIIEKVTNYLVDSFQYGFEAGMRCSCYVDTHFRLDEQMAWDIYNFIVRYKNGRYGIVPLQEAIDKNFNKRGASNNEQMAN